MRELLAPLLVVYVLEEDEERGAELPGPTCTKADKKLSKLSLHK